MNEIDSFYVVGGTVQSNYRASLDESPDDVSQQLCYSSTCQNW